MLDTQKIILGLQKDLGEAIKKGSGPFLAALYNKNGELIAKAANSVVIDSCSHNHAEMNVLRVAEEKFGTYDLGPFDLHLFVTAEPCIMCLGGILWSGVKHLHYDVSSAEVERLTGFDEGYKPNWQQEFLKRGIEVEGPLMTKEGIFLLRHYVEAGYKIYRPTRCKK